jgi:hypothetical protein
MSEIADRYRRVAGRFTERVHEVPDAAWGSTAPCDGWVARDVVRHLVEWIPEFLMAAGGPALAQGPSVDEDPVAAWDTPNAGIQALLDDPSVASLTIHHPAHRLHRAPPVSAFDL